METKHTPGPWVTGNTSPLIFGVKRGNGTEPIGFVYGPSFTEKSKYGQTAMANARLIAAAPELYDALRELLTDMVIAQGNMRKAAKRDPAWEGCAEIIQPRVDAARAAIAKAEGK